MPKSNFITPLSPVVTSAVLRDSLNLSLRLNYSRITKLPQVPLIFNIPISQSNNSPARLPHGRFDNSSAPQFDNFSFLTPPIILNQPNPCCHLSCAEGLYKFESPTQLFMDYQIASSPTHFQYSNFPIQQFTSLAAARQVRQFHSSSVPLFDSSTISHSSLPRSYLISQITIITSTERLNTKCSSHPKLLSTPPQLQGTRSKTSPITRLI